ncbi:MAG: filamentous hemagglutinin N-terminal domain-containing protein [Endomicrobium sp.]|nr:filamentous hemagglutinin N-terminal domain-containing protein [Endomicrobium sp.]
MIMWQIGDTWAQVRLATGSRASINRHESGVNGNIRNTSVIDIEVPDRNGISYNKFDEFNVTGEDLIFNNSQKALIIINEVMSEIGWSSLTGMVKVIGKKAALIIANPWGVSVNGVEFINTDKLLLVAGRINSSTSNERFEVGEEGKIEIVEKGLKHKGVLEAIAKYMKISGEVIADTIEIVTGKGTYEHKSDGNIEQVSDMLKQTEEQGSPKTRCVLSSQLQTIIDEVLSKRKSSNWFNGKEDGAVEIGKEANIYSNQLKIIANEVLNKGNIIIFNFTRIICKSLNNYENGIITTNEGEMIIDVEGNINNVVGSIISTEGDGDLRIKANEIRNGMASKVKSSRGMYIEAEKLFNLGEPEGDTHYSEYEGSGQVLSSQVKIVPHGKENVKVTSITKTSEILSQGEMSINVKDIENRSSQISSRGKLNITGNTIRNERLEFNVNRLYKVNLGGKITDIRREEKYYTNMPSIISGESVEIRSEDIILQDPQRQHLETDPYKMVSRIVAANDLYVRGKRIENRGLLLSENNKIDILFSEDLLNKGGVIGSAQGGVVESKTRITNEAIQNTFKYEINTPTHLVVGLSGNERSVYNALLQAVESSVDSAKDIALQKRYRELIEAFRYRYEFQDPIIPAAIGVVRTSNALPAAGTEDKGVLRIEAPIIENIASYFLGQGGVLSIVAEKLTIASIEVKRKIESGLKGGSSYFLEESKQHVGIDAGIYSDGLEFEVDDLEMKSGAVIVKGDVKGKVKRIKCRCSRRRNTY